MSPLQPPCLDNEEQWKIIMKQNGKPDSDKLNPIIKMRASEGIHTTGFFDITHKKSFLEINIIFFIHLL